MSSSTQYGSFPTEGSNAHAARLTRLLNATRDHNRQRNIRDSDVTRQVKKEESPPDLPLSAIPTWDENTAVKISRAMTVASYSWSVGYSHNYKTQCAAMYLPARLPQFLGEFYKPDLVAGLPGGPPLIRDWNTSAHPQSPWEPGIQAVLMMEPHFPFRGINLITDSDALLSMLNFSLGEQQAFRFGIQLLGNIVLFIRHDLPGSNTTEGVNNICRMFAKDHVRRTLGENPDPKAHYRIITYRLGGLQILLRHKIDACMEKVPNLPDSKIWDFGLLSHCCQLTLPKLTIMELDFWKRDPTLTREVEYERYMARIRTLMPATWLTQSDHLATVEYYQSPGPAQLVPGTTPRLEDSIAFANVSIFPDPSRKDHSNTSSGITVSPIAKSYEVWAQDKRAGIQDFYDQLKELLQTLHALRAVGGGNVYVVQHQEGSDDLDVFPAADVPVLPPWLTDRLTNAGPRSAG